MCKIWSCDALWRSKIVTQRQFVAKGVVPKFADKKKVDVAAIERHTGRVIESVTQASQYDDNYMICSTVSFIRLQDLLFTRSHSIDNVMWIFWCVWLATDTLTLKSVKNYQLTRWRSTGKDTYSAYDSPFYPNCCRVTIVPFHMKWFNLLFFVFQQSFSLSLTVIIRSVCTNILSSPLFSVNYLI